MIARMPRQDPVEPVDEQERAGLPDTRPPEWTIVEPPRELDGTLFNVAVQWLCPWTTATFPGFYRYLIATIAPSYSWQSLHAWRKARRRIPGPIARRTASVIRARCERGLALANALDAYATSWRDGMAEPRGIALINRMRK